MDIFNLGPVDDVIAVIKLEGAIKRIYVSDNPDNGDEQDSILLNIRLE